MRDAFGGVFTMNLLLVFIFIFVAFSAVSLNYAKAFRVKNNIIDFIEENEILDLRDLDNKIDKLAEVINNSDYQKTCNGELSALSTDDFGNVTEYCYGGVFISIKSKNKIEGTDKTIIKYNVTSVADWNLGALNKLLALGGDDENSKGTIAGGWRINGEAKVIGRIN